MKSDFDLYGHSIIVDSTAPLAPYGAIPISSTPDQLVAAYADSGVTLAIFTIVDDYPNSIEQTVKLLGDNRRYFISRSDRCILIDSVSDVRRAKSEGKIAVAFAFQGSNALMGNLTLVESYRRLGVMQMLLAYNAASLAADGCHERRNAGLSQFGRDLVVEMNRVGMIVDLTHVGERSSLEAIELTTKPPVFSHSAPKKLVSHDRNISDEQIQACAAKGGLIGLPGIGLFMDSHSQTPTASRYAETIDYVVQLVGPRHAAIGLDYVIDRDAMASYVRANAAVYGGGSQYPADGYINYASPAILRELAQQLSRRGYVDEDVRAIMGENYLRVLDANLHGARQA